MTNTCPRILVSILTAAMIAVLCVSAFSSPVASTVSESCVMRLVHPANQVYRELLKIAHEAQREAGITFTRRLSNDEQRALTPEQHAAYFDFLIALNEPKVQRRELRDQGITDINPSAEQDYDGDGGREYSDHLRDNGINARSASIGTFVQIADALPRIEAPSIVPDEANENDEAQRTLSYLSQQESKHDVPTD